MSDTVHDLGLESDGPGLESDGVVLLSAKDALEGLPRLDWSRETPVAQWDGVTVEGTPERVTKLELRNQKLTGEIPAILADLSNLVVLDLAVNVDRRDTMGSGRALQSHPAEPRQQLSGEISTTS